MPDPDSLQNYVASVYRAAGLRAGPTSTEHPHDDRTGFDKSLRMQLRKIIKARGHLPSDEAALKLIWLGLRNVVAKWIGSRHD